MINILQVLRLPTRTSPQPAQRWHRIAFFMWVTLSALTRSLSVSAESLNLIANASVEQADAANKDQPHGWSKFRVGRIQAAFAYRRQGAYAGKYSLKIQCRRYKSGAAAWAFAPVAVQPLTGYTFRDAYRASGQTDVVLRFTDARGQVIEQRVLSVDKTRLWRTLEFSFTTPADVRTLTVSHVLRSKGQLQTDDYQLIRNEITSPAIQAPSSRPQAPNLIPNPSLEKLLDQQPVVPASGWKGHSSKDNDAAFSVLNTGHSGGHSLGIQITRFVSGDAYWTYPSQPVEGGRLYVFSDVYQASVDTHVYAHVTLRNGDQQWLFVGTAYHDRQWARFEQVLAMPADAVAVDIYHSLAGVGTLVTDDYRLAEYTAEGFNRALVTLTFDDALRSVHQYGLPLMQKYRLSTTQYFLTGFSNDPLYMSIDMMRQVQSAGHEVGSHTVTHRNLTDLTAAEVERELIQSQADLQNWLGSVPHDFASPHGAYNSDVLPVIRQHYRSHRSVDTGFNSRDQFDPGNIRVQNMRASTSLQELAAWLERAKTDRTWLVLVYHGVDPAPPIADPWNTTPEQLDAQFALIQSSGVAVRTLGQALEELQPQL